MGIDLSGFNGFKTKPLGYLELMVTYRAEPPSLYRMVKTPFLVLPCKSVYNSKIGRPTLGRLGGGIDLALKDEVLFIKARNNHPQCQPVIGKVLPFPLLEVGGIL